MNESFFNGHKKHLSIHKRRKLHAEKLHVHFVHKYDKKYNQIGYFDEKLPCGRSNSIISIIFGLHDQENIGIGVLNLFLDQILTDLIGIAFSRHFIQNGGTKYA